MSSRLNVILRVEINGDRNSNNPNQNPNLHLYGTYSFSVNTILIKNEFYFTKYNLIKQIKIVKMKSHSVR
jgi:hypothetical protein